MDFEINKDLINNQNTLNSLINSMNDGVIALNDKTEITIYNAAALNIIDLNNVKLKSKIDQVLIPINKDNQTVKISEIILKTKFPDINRDLRIKYNDGSTINLYLSISPVKLDYGKKSAIGYVLLLRDITREKSLEEERDEFISVVSHELRTPIAISEGNISNAEFVANKTGDLNSIREALKEAHSQIIFLADLINDLSTLSRAERGVLEVNIEEINVNELTNELKSSYQEEAEKKGLELKLDIKENLKPLKSSRLYVKEILQNFITNSIKYTDHGFIKISVDQDEDFTIFKVKDTGIGISKTDQEKVFDKFFRSEDFRTRKSNGTGLGLYVTMKLTKLIKAKIELESALNKGSTFIISIPNLEVPKNP